VNRRGGSTKKKEGKKEKKRSITNIKKALAFSIYLFDFKGSPSPPPPTEKIY
jgi:hypothetical protein